MISLRSLPLSPSCLRNSLLLGLCIQGTALAGPQADAQMYVYACMSLPMVYRLGCLQAAQSRLQADWGSTPTPSSSSGGSWSSPSYSGIYDGAGGINILDR